MEQAFSTMAASALATAPSDDDLDAILEVAWKNAFGKKSRHPDTSIFDIGPGFGRLFRFFSDVEKTTGVALPVTTIFQAPTLLELAEIVRAGEAPKFDPLIPFRTDGHMSPLFMLPGLGGSVVQMFDLARLIRHQGPIYLNQQQGLDERHPPHRTIDEMARFQASAIKTLQPHGPYLLLGYSSGGMTAVETARLLQADGEKVLFIGLIETGLPEGLWPAWIRVQFLCRRVNHHVAKLRSMSLLKAIGYIRDHAQALRGRIGRLLGTSGGGWSPYRAEGLPPLLNELREANIEAAYGYRPNKLAGQVTIFQSNVGDPLSCKAADVWPRFVTQVDVVPVSGNHETMMRGRNVETLAARISEALGKACSCFLQEQVDLGGRMQDRATSAG